MLDIFNQDAFNVLSLTDAINEIKFVPGRLGELGIFTPSSETSPFIAIERKGDQLILVPPTPRGGSGSTVDNQKRGLIPFIIPHFEINDGVMAAEVDGVRAMGSEVAVETVQGRLAEKFGQHQNSMSATEEYARIGAVTGVITYADGSTKNLFNDFGVVQEAEVDFDLDNANPAEGVLRKKCAAVTRTIGGVLEGLPFTGLWALCGDNFFDDLLSHKEVRDTFKNWNEAQILRDGYVGPSRSSWGIFEFGGIVWENYRGSVGNTSFINADKCHIFPVGVPSLFRSYWAPADYVETVNTPGRRLYAKQYPMPNGKGVNLDVQMNALQLCTRPRSLIKGKRT